MSTETEPNFSDWIVSQTTAIDEELREPGDGKTRYPTREPGMLRECRKTLLGNLLSEVDPSEIEIEQTVWKLMLTLQETELTSPEMEAKYQTLFDALHAFLDPEAMIFEGLRAVAEVKRALKEQSQPGRRDA